MIASGKVLLIACIACISVAHAKHLQQDHRGVNRKGRWFGYRYTSTEVIPRMITSMIPSSCVQIEASLPPCRNVRKLEEFPTFLDGYTRDDINHEVIPSIHTTPLGWGEYLGIYAPTVTVTALEMHTTTMLDPKTVVTFSVKGCKPSRLPMDLELCPPMPNIQPTASITGVVPTTTMAATIAKPMQLDSAEGMPVQVHNNLETQALMPTAEQLIDVHPTPMKTV